MFIPRKLESKIIEYQNKYNVRNRRIISDKANVSLATLDKILSGAIESPKVDTLEKICLVIETTMNDLFDNPGWSVNSYNNEQNNLVSEPKTEFIVPAIEQLSVLKLQNDIIDLQKDKIKLIENELILKNELMDMKVENERLKNVYAQNTNARVGS